MGAVRFGIPINLVLALKAKHGIEYFFRDEIHRRLPGNWVISEDYRSWDKGGDCLFQNLSSLGQVAGGA